LDFVNLLLGDFAAVVSIGEFLANEAGVEVAAFPVGLHPLDEMALD
jgi:hypothetical protein